MIISDKAVDKKTAVLILAVIILVFGWISYWSLPREAAPDITIPYVFITTTYPGVAPADVEKTITVPVEKKLKGLENVKRISSISSIGSSLIAIEFVTGTDIDDVLIKVKDKVDEARAELPTDLEDDPVVFEANISEMPILVLALSGPASLVRLKDIAEDLEEDIEAIPGVLEVDVTGGLTREIRVEPFADKMAYYGISILSLQSVISNENTNVSGGAIRMGDGRFQLRVPGEFTNPEEIYGLIVGMHDNQPVYLKDTAQVVDGFKEEMSRSRLNGQRSINVQIKKRSGENLVRIVDEVFKLIEQKKPLWPKGTKVTALMDQAEGIRMMVSDLENNILTGLILVVSILFFFMGFRNAVLVSMSIPFSMFLSFSVLSALGITLNMIVLFSLTLALGMLVDNAIVIIENVYRYMEQGVPKLQAAKRATGEVAYPVIGSTATTLAAFLPLLFWPGIMGDFMKYLPITLIITLASSLFVAMVINPALAAIFMSVPKIKERAKYLIAEDIASAGEKPVEIRGFILKGYRNILSGALNHRIPVIISSFVILIILAQIWIYKVGLEKPVEFFPTTDPNSVYVNMDMPEGADLEYADRISRQVESVIAGAYQEQIPPGNVDPAEIYASDQDKKKYTLGQGQQVTGLSDIANIEHIYSRAITETGSANLFSDRTPTHIGVQFYDLEDRLESSKKTLETIRSRVAKIPGAGITTMREEDGPPTGAPINIEISGDNFQILGQIAAKVKHVLERIPFVEDIRDDYVAGSPTVQVKVDRQRATMLGLSTEVIGFALKVAFNGLKVSTYREADEDYDITVQLPEEDRRGTDILRELLLPTPNGQLVPLSTVAKYKIVGGLGKISRINHERAVTVKANVDELKAPGPVVRAKAEELLKDFELPPGYKIKFTGEFESQKEAEEFLSKAFLAAAFLIVILLVNQFNSVSQPLIIMTSIILSLGGVFLGLTIMDMPFGIIMTGVGVISLAGVVVNNAIVMIDYINKLRERGYEVTEAIIAAGCTRLRPVLLTATTTILGLIPMVTGISYDFSKMQISWVSESAQMWSPMASAVIFGLALATVLTLLVVPTLYSLVYTAGKASGKSVRFVKKIYWAPFYKITGTKPDTE